MKLATKISLLAVTIALMLSQLFNYLQLYYNRQWMIQQIRDVYIEMYTDFYDSYRNNINYMLSTYRKNDYKDSGYDKKQEALWLRFRQAYMINCFEEKHAAMYQGEQELVNLTGYDFQVQKLRGNGLLSASQLQKVSSNNIDYDEGWLQWADVIDTENERQILVFLGSLEVEEDEFTLFYCVDLTEMFQSSRQVFLTGLMIALVVSGVTVLLLYFVVRLVLRPLRDLKVAADSIADGNYEKRIPVVRSDEVGQIAKNFNRMAEHVQNHVDSLNRTTSAQKQLIGALAHELKTPMTAMIGAAQTLKNVKVTPEQSERLLSHMESECMRLSRLSLKMQDLTGLYNMEGQSALEQKPTDVEKYLKTVHQLALPLLAQSGISLYMEIKEEPAWNCAHEKSDKIHQKVHIKRMDEDLAISLLLNLIDNARKASSRGGSIFVTAWSDELWVADRGRGIPADEIERITEAFYMVDKSRSRAAGGMGLGLTLCQQIAELHGWKMEIRSVEGEGTTVVVKW